MTSWLNARSVQPMPVEKTAYLFETGGTGFCSQFNEFLYSYMYAKAEKKQLYVNDIQNPVSTTYQMIKNTFSVPVTEVLFTDTYVATAAPMNRRGNQLRGFLSKLSGETLRTEAKNLLQWNSVLVNKIQNILKVNTLSKGGYDVGVHLGSGEMRNFNVSQYLDAVLAYQKSSKKTALNIFVMSGSESRLSEFQKKKDPSWTIYYITSPNLQTSTATRKMESYLHFMTELYMVRNIQHVVTAFSSNVGRFIYLTAATQARVVSVDTPVFSPI